MDEQAFTVVLEEGLDIFLVVHGRKTLKTSLLPMAFIGHKTCFGLPEIGSQLIKVLIATYFFKHLETVSGLQGLVAETLGGRVFFCYN